MAKDKLSDTYVPDSQILANQQKAAALGISIPGVGGKIAPANTASASNLGQQPFKTPPVTPATGYAGLIESANASITTLTPTVDADKAKIQGKYDRLGQLPTEKADQYKTEGVYDKQKTYNDLVNTINQKDLAYRRKVEKIQNENPTGQLAEGQNIAMQKVEREWASEKADLAIGAAFAKDDYTLAKTIVDDKIKAETEGLTNELAGLQFFYTQNYNQLSDERKKVLEFQMKQISDEKAATEQRLSEISAIQLAAAENGAPANVIMSIGKSADLTGALTTAGSWVDKNIDRKGDGGGYSTVDLAPEDERILVGAGFSVADIKDLKRSVAEFGIDAAIAAVDTPAQKAAIRKVYNVAEKVTRASISSAITQKMAVDSLESAYTTDELTKLARESGFAKWYQGKGTELKNFLASEKAKEYYVNQLVDQYKAAGMFEGQ